MLDDVTISNGIGWSPDGGTMYYIDSMAYRVDAFDFDVGTGEISGRRPLIVIERGGGIPDGLAVDDEGGIWVALWGRAAIRRYSPDGELDGCSTCRRTTSPPAASAATTVARST